MGPPKDGAGADMGPCSGPHTRLKALRLLILAFFSCLLVAAALAPLAGLLHCASWLQRGQQGAPQAGAGSENGLTEILSGAGDADLLQVDGPEAALRDSPLVPSFLTVTLFEDAQAVPGPAQSYAAQLWDGLLGLIKAKEAVPWDGQHSWDGWSNVLPHWFRVTSQAGDASEAHLEGASKGDQVQSPYSRASSARAHAAAEQGQGRRSGRRRLVLKWLAQSWVKGVTFRRFASDDINTRYLVGGNDTSTYPWLWPNGPIGDLRSPFVEAVDVTARRPQCQGVVPDEAYERDPPPLAQDKDVAASDMGKGPATDERYLVWVPRFGLGNALRGYCSTFIYALLSGRRLLRWHGGVHQRVLDLLCSAFQCGGGQLIYGGDMRSIAESLNVRLGSKQLALSLYRDTKTLWVHAGHFFKGYWGYDRDLKKCVFEAMACGSEWCLRTRALRHLLGPPKPEIGRVIEDQIVRHNARASSPKAHRRLLGPGTAWGAGNSTNKGSMKSGKISLGRRSSDPAVLPHDTSRETSATPVASVEVTGDTQGMARLKLAASRGGMEVEDCNGAATGLRCQQTQERRTRQAGRVLKEKGAGGSVAKGGKGDEEGISRDGTVQRGFGLRLHFDVAVHVRTQASAVEADKCDPAAPKCQAQLKKLEQEDKTRLKTYVDPSAWACMWKLLEELRGLKAKQRRKSPKDIDFNIFLATDNVALRPQYVEALSRYGSVFHSAGHVAHTSKSTDLSSNLVTMSEFYLLSRAHVMVSFTKYVSTFALFAAMYGNATLLARHPQPDSSHCHFKVENLGYQKH